MLKSNAVEVQRLFVLWLIAMYCLSYSKALKLEVTKQLIMAVGPLLGLLADCKTAAEEFPVGLNNIAMRVKAAAGMYINIPCVNKQYSDSMPSSAERALRIHRINIQTALIVLFESPVPETYQVSQAVLSSILGANPSDFVRQLINISANVHLSRPSRSGVPPIV
jgi:hypothetical protein